MPRSQSDVYAHGIRCARRRPRGIVTFTVGAIAILLSAIVATNDAEAVAPPAPPGCGTPIATSVENTTSTDIPDAGVLTSTIEVTGAGAHLTDLDLFTNIEHTWNNDLDITLQSPAGTVATITTDNGGSNNNTFAGTTFDDQADPDGQVPYTVNPGLTTDNPYTNNIAATPLVPEEAMAAFQGENPNGTWTLTISDDDAGDSGTLQSWRLDIQSLAVAPAPTATQHQSTTPVAIPGGPAVVTSTIGVTGAGTHLTDLDLVTNIEHTWNNDLDVTLQSPAGTVATITTDNAGGNDNTFAGTTFDDQADPDGQVPYTVNPGVTTDNPYANNIAATPLVPEEAMAAFQGENPNGTWTLTISDDNADDSGTLQSWRLDVMTGSCPPSASPSPTPTPSPTATPSPSPTPEPASLRLQIARLSVFAPEADARCRLTTGKIDSCRVRLRASGHVVARGERSVAGGAESMGVRLRLTRYGRRLLDRRLGGVRAGVAATDGTRTARARTRAILTVERFTTPPGAWNPNEAELTRTGRRFLRRLRGRLIAVSSYRCVGHTAALRTNSPESERAIALSRARAKLVCGALRRFGAAGKRTVVARGGTDPITQNTTKSGRAENRRVEVMLRH